MAHLPYPRLRPFLDRADDPGNPRYLEVVDRLGLAPPLRLTVEEYSCLELFDGRRSFEEIHREGVRRGRGPFFSQAHLMDLARRLEDNLFLEGPSFRRIIEAPVRPPRCIGCYEGDPDALRRQLTRLFTDAGGPGLPGPCRPDPRLRGALVPHIDYPRGGGTYAWGFKEVVEKTAAGLFVIIGTSHYSNHRFTLTRKNFESPLGVVPTDQEFIDRLVSHYGHGLFDDELLAHLPEHSIELEVVLLQYLYEGKRPIRIVPLVVGPFFDYVQRRDNPSACTEIGRMTQALRRADAETPEPICYLISGDLAHIGPKFQDPAPLTSSRLQHSRRQDFAVLRHAEAGHAAGYFDLIAEESDERNICGLPPTFTFLEALRPNRGKMLHYDQYVHPRGHESVSFASMTFYNDRMAQ